MGDGAPVTAAPLPLSPLDPGLCFELVASRAAVLDAAPSAKVMGCPGGLPVVDRGRGVPARPTCDPAGHRAPVRRMFGRLLTEGGLHAMAMRSLDGLVRNRCGRGTDHTGHSNAAPARVR